MFGVSKRSPKRLTAEWYRAEYRGLVRSLVEKFVVGDSPAEIKAQGIGLKTSALGLKLGLGRSVGALSLYVTKTYGFTIG